MTQASVSLRGLDTAFTELPLTIKAPNENCSRRHFDFLLLSFDENKA